MKILKFLAVLAALAIVAAYVPFGLYICMAVNAVALWNLVNGNSK
jgi:hypothetical protein